jgi:putative spermidine/putrescine transport system substrate-binding protein
MTVRVLGLLVAAVVLLAGCGGSGGGARVAARDTAGGSWPRVLDQARGQTVNWWMYGGDDRVNAYVRRYVTPSARRLGVTVRVVPITDTADAISQVVSERRAGQTSGGKVDLIWINGENFASGKKAGLWLKGWARRLPNARYVDWSDPSISRDFQVRVDGQESPWSRAAFVYATDTARVSHPPKDLDALLAWARAHPGRFTYPAPPDFTGSAFVREVVQAKGEDAAFRYLAQLKPLMYRHGEVLPKSEAELDQLFGDGQVDFAMSYDANFVLTGVRTGQFSKTVRPFVVDDGTLTNTSYVAIPADAAHPAAAEVLANLLLSPRLQAVKADPDVLGIPAVLDRARLSPAQRRRFDDAVSSPYVLRNLGRTIQELPAGRVGEIESRWKREVLRKP